MFPLPQTETTMILWHHWGFFQQYTNRYCCAHPSLPLLLFIWFYPFWSVAGVAVWNHVHLHQVFCYSSHYIHSHTNLQHPCWQNWRKIHLYSHQLAISNQVRILSLLLHWKMFHIFIFGITTWLNLLPSNWMNLSVGSIKVLLGSLIRYKMDSSP